jgi:hypothetical protein
MPINTAGNTTTQRPAPESDSSNHPTPNRARTTPSTNRPATG